MSENSAPAPAVHVEAWNGYPAHVELGAYPSQHAAVAGWAQLYGVVHGPAGELVVENSAAFAEAPQWMQQRVAKSGPAFQWKQLVSALSFHLNVAIAAKARHWVVVVWP